MPLTKLLITVEHSGEKIEVMFNPEEYTVNKDNNFASQAILGLSSPLLQFVNVNLLTLEMELLFDTSEKRQDVRDETNKIVNLLAIDSELHAPPILIVSWASLQLRCVLARVGQKYTMFADDGRPIRARLTVSFQEKVEAEREAKEVNRQTADFSKVHVVKLGETLSGIAARYYNNPETWRPIAIANRIADPRVI